MTAPLHEIHYRYDIGINRMSQAYCSCGQWASFGGEWDVNDAADAHLKQNSVEAEEETT